MASQALGVAEAAGFPFVEKPLTVRRPWIWAAPSLWVAPLHGVTQSGRRLTPPWPDAVIGCGRNAVRPALAIKRASGGRTIAAHVQDPRFGADRFDLMIVPRARSPARPARAGHRGRRASRDAGASRRRASRAFRRSQALPRPIVGVLIGGANGAYRLDKEMLAEIADRIAAAVKRRGGSVVATPSRRTGPDGVRLLRERLAGIPGQVWDGSGENPYFAYLAVADALIVTADSVSMVSEAAATGKPVHIIDLPGGDAKFARFHAAMRDAGITRPFAGEIEHWSYRPPDDTARAGAALRDLVPRARLATGTCRMKPAGFFAGTGCCSASCSCSSRRSISPQPGCSMCPARDFRLPTGRRWYRSKTPFPGSPGSSSRLSRLGAVWLALIGRPLWRLDRKALVFIVAATALGPGLIANTVLKDNWGRARPYQTDSFGGTRQFTPAPLPAAQCERNCAFVSGHAALAFSARQLCLPAPGRQAPAARDRDRARVRDAGRDRADRRRGAFSVGCRAMPG